ncbi:hypothetical protein FKM82_006211 [Ascaphus truei]
MNGADNPYWHLMHVALNLLEPGIHYFRPKVSQNGISQIITGEPISWGAMFLDIINWLPQSRTTFLTRNSLYLSKWALQGLLCQ